MSIDVEHLVHRLAAHQEGVLSDRQLRTLGLTRDQIRHRIRSGRFDRSGPGCVAMPGCPATWRQPLMAAWLRAERRAVVSHRWAAVLLGLEGIDADQLAGPPDLLVSRAVNHRRAGLRFHTTRRIDPIEIVTVRRDLPSGIRRDRFLREAGLVTHFRVTSASRTIIDLAAVVDEETLGRLIDSACSSGRTSPAHLRRRLDAVRRSGRPGVGATAAALADAGGHSLLERRLLSALRRAGLPRPSTQVVHRRGATAFARVDFDFAPIPLVVEVSGRRGHSSDADRARDARRRNELQAAGVTVLEFSWSAVVDHTDGVIAEIARHLVRRAPGMDLRRP